MWCKLKLPIFSEPTTARYTAEQRGANAGELPLNIVQVDRYTVFSDSENIVECSPSGLSTPNETVDKDKERLAWQVIK